MERGFLVVLGAGYFVNCALCETQGTWQLFGIRRRVQERMQEQTWSPRKRGPCSKTAKVTLASVDTPMKTFWPWLSAHTHRLALLRRLIESADAFDPTSYNQAFDAELEALQQQIPDLEVSAKLDKLKGMNWGGYIAKQIRLAGFRGGEVDEYVHHIIVKLLVAPGKLFHGWNPQQHGPLDRRFGASVRNEIANIISKTQNRRKYVPTVSITNDYNGHGVAEKYLPPARSQNDSVIADFSDWLRSRLGPLAVAVLNARLHGDDMAMLVGDEALGRPTRHKLRTTLQAIKQAGWEYADGDASLRSRIEELLDQDKQRAERMRVAGARAEA